MAGEYVYNLESLTKQHGTTTILDGINLAFFFGAKIGVIGANGSGKSTLLRIMAGLDKDYMGQLYVAPRARIGYLEQEPQMDLSKSVAEVVAEGVAVQQSKLNRYDELCGKLGETLSDAESDKVSHEMAALQDEIDRQSLWELDHHVEMAMDALRLPPPETPTKVLSGGERRRVALCRLLLSNPDVLLLDEPTNHLDAESVGWIEEHLKRFAGTLIVVTHARYFLSNVTEWILELEGGHGYPYKGNYTAWLEQKQAQSEKQASQNASRKKVLEQELAWVRMNAAGRQAKSKARLKRYEEMAAQEVDTREDNLIIQIPHGRRLGDQVVDAINLSKAYGDRLLMEKVTFTLPRGGIVGIIGGNGSGKTTLFRMITKQEQPTAGELRVGESVDVAYVDQNRDALNPDNSVYEEISGGVEIIELGGPPPGTVRSDALVPGRKMNSRAYCSRFNFKGTEQQKKVGKLSGGERNRVHLAKLLRTGGNLLLLDEPTNDLDVNTLRSLEEGLQNFGGCAVVISHDRWFLDRVATHILAFEGDSEVVWFEGNYQAYYEWRKAKFGEKAAQPHRIRYRPLAR